MYTEFWRPSKILIADLKLAFKTELRRRLDFFESRKKYIERSPYEIFIYKILTPRSANLTPCPGVRVHPLRGEWANQNSST
jgi:hypothetical protein